MDAWSMTLETSFMGKIQSCSKRLEEWNSKSFGHIGRCITKKENEALSLLQNIHVQGAKARFKAWKEELDELLRREELMWKQKSRDMWIKEGDKNTRFFHGYSYSSKK